MKLLTVKETADILRCSQEHVRRLLRAGKLRGFSEGRRSGFRILEKDLEEYVAKKIRDAMLNKENLPSESEGTSDTTEGH
ncbi:MAG: helix-turn-helix domain-containing protein [Candidatus Ancaeobacter aquaticus]|nr:helix-turn-helix domain-containing protein [Candidatus Ancaeobacter aquaticus]